MRIYLEDFTSSFGTCSVHWMTSECVFMWTLSSALLIVSKPHWQHRKVTQHTACWVRSVSVSAFSFFSLSFSFCRMVLKNTAMSVSWQSRLPIDHRRAAWTPHNEWLPESSRWWSVWRRTPVLHTCTCQPGHGYLEENQRQIKSLPISHLEKFSNRYHILKAIKTFKHWIYIYANMSTMMSTCRFIENQQLHF